MSWSWRWSQTGWRPLAVFQTKLTSASIPLAPLAQASVASSTVTNLRTKSSSCKVRFLRKLPTRIVKKAASENLKVPVVSYSRQCFNDRNIPKNTASSLVHRLGRPVRIHRILCSRCGPVDSWAPTPSTPSPNEQSSSHKKRMDRRLHDCFESYTRIVRLS